MSDLPFGLRPYEPGEFDRVHAAGSGILTASMVPALFGHSRFAGRYAIAAHISGQCPLPEVDNPMTRRGKLLEPVVAKMLEGEDYAVDRHDLGIYARHATIEGFGASPDVVVWDESDVPASLEPGIGEIKVVSELIYKDTWADGPPLEVELQHQAQYACCPGAEWGVIAALVVGAFRLDLVVYRTTRNPGAIKLIEDAAKALLDMLAAGQLPEPDTHESAAAVLQALHPVDPCKEIALAGAEAVEAGRLFDDWKAASETRLAAEKTEKAAKAWFMARAGDASRLLIGNDRRVEIKDVSRAGYTVKPSSYRQVKLIEASAA